MSKSFYFAINLQAYSQHLKKRGKSKDMAHVKADDCALIGL